MGGKGKVWMDPNEVNEIALGNSRRAVKKLIKDSFIIKKKDSMHSRTRARVRIQERRLRTLRRLLIKYREAKKIDKHLYHQLYLACKANQYKSKKNLADAVEKIIYKKNLAVKTGGQKTALAGRK